MKSRCLYRRAKHRCKETTEGPSIFCVKHRDIPKCVLLDEATVLFREWYVKEAKKRLRAMFSFPAEV